VTIIYGTTVTREVPQYLPSKSFTLSGTPVSVTDGVLFLLPLLATIGLWYYFRVARTGLAMRAVVDNADLLDLTGTSPDAIRRRAWIIGVTFAGLSGVLLAPLLAEIDGTSLTFLVITAFGAAAIGGFSSLPLTYVGGLVIGLAGSFATTYLQNGFFAQLPSTLPFLILFAVLLVFPRRRLADRATSMALVGSRWRGPLKLQGAFGLVLLGVLIAVPFLVGPVHLGDWTTFLANIILFLSLGLLVKSSGQVSLCQVTFVAIGAEAFSHLTIGDHVPWLLALAISGLIAVPIGALLAIPAIRLSGLYLALASLGFAIVVQYMFFTESFMFGPAELGSTVPRPDVAWLPVASDRGYYYLLLFFAVATSAFVIGLNRTRLGRLLRAMSDSPTGLAASGTSVNLTRILVFCLSAGLAAISGALAGAVPGIVAANSYTVILSITYFAVVVISTGWDPWYAIAAAAGITLIPSYLHTSNITSYLTVVFGAAAVAYALTPEDRRGPPIRLRQRIDQLFGVEKSAIASTEVGADASPRPAVELTPSTLRASAITVRFGGLVAVDDVTLESPTGRVTGVIGPNGAGKTTLFNVCSGLQPPSSGDIYFDGRSINRLSSAARARMGLGRTFQHIELFDSLTVRQNVELGREGAYAGFNPLGHIVGRRRQRALIRNAADEALDLCGLLHLANATAGVLSTGQRRLLELARCLAGPFRVLLLDEPSSGLDHTETEVFGEILRRVVRERGIGVLLVEHDMALVTAICEYIYVLDFGRLVFEGTVSEVVASSIVRSAYLGDEFVLPTEA
jgi:ABC-type branched-subunit amino acid transport system ATPase component/ABC-type branched-subunit amino acid transport system permease subunit